MPISMLIAMAPAKTRRSSIVSMAICGPLRLHPYWESCSGLHSLPGAPGRLEAGGYFR